MEDQVSSVSESEHGSKSTLDDTLEKFAAEEAGESPGSDSGDVSSGESEAEASSAPDPDRARAAWQARQLSKLQLKEENERLSKEKAEEAKAAATLSALLKYIPGASVTAEAAKAANIEPEPKSFFRDPRGYVDQSIAPLQETMAAYLDSEIAKTEAEIAEIDRRERVAEQAGQMGTDVTEWEQYNPGFRSRIAAYRDDFVSRSVSSYGASPQHAESVFWDNMAKAWEQSEQATASGHPVHPCDILESNMRFFYGAAVPQPQPQQQPQQQFARAPAAPYSPSADALAAAREAGLVASTDPSSGFPYDDVSTDGIISSGFDGSLVARRITGSDGLIDKNALFVFAKELEERGYNL